MATPEGGTWVCLQCCELSCGRYSEYRHALKHYFDNVREDEPHFLIVNTVTLQVWCYECDEGLDEMRELIAKKARRRDG